LIGSYLRENRIGEVVCAPCGVFLTEINAYQPDILFIRTERIGIIKDHGVEGAPDLVVEVLSPSTANLDKGAKKKIYAATGVQEMWLADPKMKVVSVFDLTKSVDSPIATYRENQSFQSDMFPGLAISCEEIFRDIRRRSRKSRTKAN